MLRWRLTVKSGPHQREKNTLHRNLPRFRCRSSLSSQSLGHVHIHTHSHSCTLVCVRAATSKRSTFSLLRLRSYSKNKKKLSWGWLSRVGGGEKVCRHAERGFPWTFRVALSRFLGILMQIPVNESCKKTNKKFWLDSLVIHCFQNKNKF